ncbi:hypothetical protein SARC_07328 [Sphaeroforma arctica JP610]|uniref:Integrase catalytic domain-containing protein n=1 Tax=Sphaeroforma arctica JP610 TaxID=667725 RepID=A0A0L0FTZ6_9EUKA|nr:hypothetical protein SARC_07328 [Sphaeroforma arctica JP610]KNC80315.1 hypothetical protein SARC_07328 [Sphaeroforma arctica JP610]|eukprot:XP_014154217.1 hypothetical protein SARC_07328 [Sphaeroforma arctica JP610]
MPTATQNILSVQVLQRHNYVIYLPSEPNKFVPTECHILQNDELLHRNGQYTVANFTATSLENWHDRLGHRCDPRNTLTTSNTTPTTPAKPSHDDWKLNPTLVKTHVTDVFGEIGIDLFAQKHNAQVPVYCSLEPDAPLHDAFKQSWQQPNTHLYGNILSVSKHGEMHFSSLRRKMVLSLRGFRFNLTRATTTKRNFSYTHMWNSSKPPPTRSYRMALRIPDRLSGDESTLPPVGTVFHVDLHTGLPTSPTGYTCNIKYVDANSGQPFVYPLRHNDDASATLDVFYTDIGKDYLANLRELKCDRGGKFVSKEFNSVNTLQHVKVTCIPTNTPQLHGLVERTNEQLV